MTTYHDSQTMRQAKNLPHLIALYVRMFIFGPNNKQKNMQKFEVGKNFPYPNTSNGMEIARLSFNTNLFDVIYYINGSSGKDIQVWKKSKLKYALYQQAKIPFPIFLFPNQNWSFDLSMNIYKAEEDKVEDWLNNDGNIVTLFLIDAKTNILLAMRTIGVKPKWSEKLRDILEDQWNEYDSAQKVDLAIDAILNTHSTSEMLAKTQILDI